MTSGSIEVGVTAGRIGVGANVVSGVGSGCAVTGVGATVGPTGDGTGAVAVGSVGLVDESDELAANAGTATASATAVPASVNTRGFFDNGTSMTRGPAVAGSLLTPSPHG